jgi:cytochrome c-type biogenesis protein CcmH/NrfG
MRGRRGRGMTMVACLLMTSLAAGCAGVAVKETPDTLMKDGQKLYLAKQYDEAIPKLERVIELDSTRWPAYVALARCYMAKGNFTLAVTNARIAYQAEPGGEDVLQAFSEALLAGGTEALRTARFTLALADFTDYLSLHPNDAHGFLGVAQAYTGEGRYADALAAFTRGFERDRSGALREALLQALLDSGTQALHQGQAKSAVALLQEYVHQEPGNSAGYLTLGKALLAAGYRSDARGALGRALQLNPGQREASDLLGELR